MDTAFSRRTLITGLASLVAAPAIVRASSLMPVKTYETILFPDLVNYFAAAARPRSAQELEDFKLTYLKLLYPDRVPIRYRDA